MPKTRTVTCAALFIYCMGLIAFAIYPSSSIDWFEWIIIVAATLAAFGVVAHAFDTVEIPYEQYAYLVVGWVGFSLLLLYLIDTDRQLHAPDRDRAVLAVRVHRCVRGVPVRGGGAWVMDDNLEGSHRAADHQPHHDRDRLDQAADPEVRGRSTGT